MEEFAQATVEVFKKRIALLETELAEARARLASSVPAIEPLEETAQLLARIGTELASEHDVQKLVQSVTDIATKLVGAEFGSFFHNVINERGESYLLYTISGVPKEAFAKFPMPRNTAVFAPTFQGTGVVRSDDITLDPRYGKNAPHAGMPPGHLPVRSYLAVPVTSRSGEVLGGLFFGHAQPGVFTERHSELVKVVAAHAAVAIDNARLFDRARWSQVQLERANGELRSANRDLETFAYSASHDLQEPLRNIAISAQLLQRQAPNLSAHQETLVGSIVKDAKRMETLVKDLLSYTQASKTSESLPEAVDTEEVFKTVLQSLRVKVEESDANLTSVDLPVVTAHKIHLEQLFQNLIGNALKYRRQERPHVHVSARQRDGWWIFSVADNGIGIDAHYSDQIFALFQRLHDRQRYDGTGVGLALCRRIIEHYGGRVWLESSTPNVGSTFCFSLPIAPVSSGTI